LIRSYRGRLVAASVGMALLAAACSSPPRSVPPPTSSPPPTTRATLLIGAASVPGGHSPLWFAVTVAEGSEAAAYGLELSPQTAVPVPGYGSLTLEQTMATGGRPLVASTVSGLLGIGLDRSAVVAVASPPQLAGGTAYEVLPQRPTPSDIQGLVSAHLSGVRLTTERAFGRKVELQDASGSATGARQAVLLLAAAGFQTVRQAAGGGVKARTQIVVYSGTEASLSVGSDAADALGAGSVVVAKQTPRDRTQATPQSEVVFDVTVILGADFAAQANGDVRGVT